MQEINLAIAFDQNYISPFYALITSIFENNRSNKIIIHAIVSGLSEEIKNNISNYALKNNAKINYYTIDEQTVAQYVLTSTWTAAVYYRLYFPLLVPNAVNRLLYIDTDTIVVNNLAELYAIDLEHYPVGAVYDTWVKTAPHLDITEEGQYFNSGVLLMDIQKWKTQQITEKAFAFLNTNPEKIKFVDQDALNAVLVHNWKKLDAKFNMMYSSIPEGISKQEMKTFISDKVIVHFTLQRPWNLLCRNRFREFYFYYLQKSPSRQMPKITDFAWQKIPDLIKIRLTEFYYDSPRLQNVWRKLKEA